MNEDLCRLDQAGKQSLGFRIFSITWTVLSFLLIISGLFAWLYHRNKLVYLNKRGLVKIFLISLGVIASLVTGSIDRSIPARSSNAHSCVVLNLGFLLGVPYIILGAFSQVLLFRNRAKLYQYLSLQSDLKASSRLLFNHSERLDAQLSKKLKKRLYYANHKVVYSIIFILFIIATGLAVLVTVNLCPEFGLTDECVIASGTDYRITSFLLVFTLSGLFLVIYIKKGLKTYPDPFNILREVETGLILGSIIALPGLVLSVVDYGSPNDKEEPNFSYGPLLDLMFIFVLVYTVHYQVYKAMKFDEVQVAYKDISLNVVLKDKAGRNLFKAHLVSEFSLENLYFIEAVEKFKTSPPEEIERRARGIFNVYFKEHTLNLSYPISRAIKKAFEQDEISLSMFDDAFDEIWCLAESDIYPRFQRTVAYENYLGLRSGNEESFL